MASRRDPAPPEHRRLVLVVEDERGLRRFVRRVLENEGYECLEAGSAEEALVAVDRARRPVDLLILDIMLPDSWGTRLVEDVRARSPSLGVVLTSGYADADPVLGAGTQQRRPFLAKPFEASELLAAVREAEDARR